MSQYVLICAHMNIYARACIDMYQWVKIFENGCLSTIDNDDACIDFTSMNSYVHQSVFV